MLDELCKEIVKRHSVAVDANIHAPHSSDADDRNFHAHILMTTRRATPSGLGEKTRELDDKKSGEVQFWRENFADITNKHLEKSGHHARIDHRSYKDQDIDREATLHEGPATTALRKKGLENDIIISNNLVIERNQKRLEQQKDFALLNNIETEITSKQQAISALENDKNNIVQSYDKFWKFQTTYNNFLTDFNNSNSTEKQSQVIEKHNFMHEVKDFENACAFLKNNDLEPTRPPKNLFSIFKKTDNDIFITLEEIQGFMPIFSEPMKHIKQMKKEEEKRLEQQQEDVKKAFEREAKEEKDKLNRSLEIEKFFKDFDKTGARLNFAKSFRPTLRVFVETIELMTELQAKYYVDKNPEEFDKYTQKKYEKINELIPDLYKDELQFIKKIIESDQSIKTYNTDKYTEKLSTSINEIIENMDYQATQKPRYEHTYERKQEHTRSNDFDL